LGAGDARTLALNVMKNRYKTFSPDTHPWRIESEYQVNGTIAAGMNDENTLVVGADGFFLFDNVRKSLVFEERESNISKSFSAQNSIVTLPNTDKTFHVFGMRGGIFNFCGNDNWTLNLIPIEYGVTHPVLTRREVEIILNPGFGYNGGFLAGSFSRDDKKLMLLTCEGLIIYSI